MAHRSAQRWRELSPSYRQRLERSGITRQRYLAGEPLQKARGHRSREHEQQQRRVRYLYEKFTKRDILDQRIITPELLRLARAEKGDRWVLDRLEALKRDATASDRGETPHAEDTDYRRRANKSAYERGENPFAPFYWYHIQSR